MFKAFIVVLFCVQCIQVNCTALEEIEKQIQLELKGETGTAKDIFEQTNNDLANNYNNVFNNIDLIFDELNKCNSKSQDFLKAGAYQILTESDLDKEILEFQAFLEAYKENISNMDKTIKSYIQVIGNIQQYKDDTTAKYTAVTEKLNDFIDNNCNEQ